MSKRQINSNHIIVIVGLILILVIVIVYKMTHIVDQNSIKVELVTGCTLTPAQTQPNDHEKEVVPMTDLQKEPMVEKFLGENFKVQSVRQGAEQITDVFTVTIVVQILKKDETDYDKLYAKRQDAIREAVTVVLRSSSLEDRNQTSLTTIRRNVKKAINEILEVPYVQGVLCVDPIIELS
jgi:hypothetical protein